MKMRIVTGLALGAAILVLSDSAFADDHLFTASNSQGVEQRGFTNPVAGNPSGTAGAQAQPGTVPGLGDPKVGEDTGTPAFSAEALAERLEAKQPF